MTARSPEQRVRAVLPPGLLARLDHVTPMPRGHASDSARLSEAGHASAAALEAGLSERPASTRRAYIADWRRWWAWCELNACPPSPARPDDVALYVAVSFMNGTSAATVDRWAAALGIAHALAGHPSPTTRPPADALLREIRRDLPGRQTRARPLTDTEFHQLLQALPGDDWPQTPTRRRDALILTLARASGLRPDPLLDLHVTHVVQGQSPRGPVLHIDTAPEPLVIPAATAPQECAVCAHLLWRDLLDVVDADPSQARAAARSAANPPHRSQDHACARRRAPHRPEDVPLMRRLYRGGSIGTDRPSLRTVNALLTAYAEHADIPTDGLSAISLRSGTVRR